MRDGDLREAVAEFQAPHLHRSLWQVATSFGGFLTVCAGMYVLVDLAYWAALALAPLAAGFLVRVFIIQHDCGHLAFFRTKRANDVLGCACSLFTMTPYASWRRQHAGHHGIWNDLDRRQSGADIYSSCLTVTEYRALTTGRRWLYRISRHPIVANVLLPPVIFLVIYRVPFDTPRKWQRERRSVHLTNCALFGVLATLGFLLGFGKVASVQLPIMILASIVGVWLFSIQHRGEDIRWVRQDAWSSTSAALQGSTYMRLPALLQWFTGNIGYHHVHHLNPKIPNYRLQTCHESTPALQAVPTCSLQAAFRALRLVLWDEDRGRLVAIREVAVD